MIIRPYIPSVRSWFDKLTMSGPYQLLTMSGLYQTAAQSERARHPLIAIREYDSDLHLPEPTRVPAPDTPL